jgi:hypothetical protein
MKNEVDNMKRLPKKAALKDADVMNEMNAVDVYVVILVNANRFRSYYN